MAVDGDDSWDGLARQWDGLHGPKATLQAAIDVASRRESDEIVVADGFYTGPGNKNLSLQSKVLVIRSDNGPENCVIDCEDDGRAFHLYGKENADTVIEGFTVRNGRSEGTYENPYGGGIYCLFSSPTIENCQVVQNFAKFGGGIACRYASSPTLRGCEVAQNAVASPYGDANGGGIFCEYDSSPRIIDCSIIRNSIEGGNGAGISCTFGSGPFIIDCRISENAGNPGSGVGLYCGDSSSPYVVNTEITANTA
ncbi:MAG: right-handed parallel beta-helix repeat-containing protein, partial [Planctomycetota bacterium]